MCRVNSGRMSKVRQSRRSNKNGAQRGTSRREDVLDVVETIGGGSSEVQKNIIARRLLGLPKNF